MNIFGLSYIFCFFKLSYGPNFRYKAATFLQLLSSIVDEGIRVILNLFTRRFHHAQKAQNAHK